MMMFGKRWYRKHKMVEGVQSCVVVANEKGSIQVPKAETSLILSY